MKKPKFQTPILEHVAKHKADSIVNHLSLDEKISMIQGHNGFFIKGNKKHKIPDIYLSDASQGVHIRESFVESDLSAYALPKSVAFPNTLCLAATWNPKIAYDYAKSIGEECKAAGAGILLGPGMNIYRNSQNGRNFEYLGEDPYLASRMVEQYVVGVQNVGIIATLKHFIANNSDYRRRASNSLVSERALQEIYMPAFKAGIDAGALAVMTSYNQVNGEWAGQSNYVINHLLRKELGFSNIVMSDWWSLNDGKAVIQSGQDLDMPDGKSLKDIKALITNKSIREDDINKMCSRIIKTLIQMNFIEKNIKDSSYLNKFDKHEQVALATAREGIVLLRNESNILPIDNGTFQKILITGKFIHKNVSGGGSGSVKGYNHHTIYEALSDVYPNIEYLSNPSDTDFEQADIVFISVGTWDHEGCDRPFELSKDQEDMIQRASKINKKTVVIVNSGSGINMKNWVNVKGIIYNWYPGQVGNIALAEILTGKTNPSGKLPMTIEKDFKDSPAYGYIPDSTKFLSNLSGYLDLDLNKNNINPWSFDTPIEQAPKYLYDINYKEGVLVGYRWYDTKNISTQFPFGFGLSYTSFDYENVVISSNNIQKDGTVQISIDIKNTGKSDGATTIQVYVGENNPKVIRPLKELKSFHKTFINSGETKRVTLNIGSEAFSYWSEETKEWEINPGEFTIYIGESSSDIFKKFLVNVKN